MSKIVITNDLHFGVPGRLHDILWACRALREYVFASNIDTVFVLGDLFHDRRSLDIEVLSHVSKFLKETKDEYNQQWIVFPGNHDMFLRHSWEINSLTSLCEHLTVIEDVKIVKVDNTRFWVVPFITYEKSYMRVLKAIQPHIEPGDNLLTHVGICGATMNTCFLLQNWNIIDFAKFPFNRIYTGHFHNKQQIGENVWYPGTPIPFKFDEGDITHGFYCLDLETDTHKFIDIWKAGEKFLPDEEAPPQFHTFLDELLNEKTEQHVKGNMIRVLLQREYTNHERQAIKQRLLDLGAKAVRWLNLKQEQTEIIKEKQTRHKDLFLAWYEADTKGHAELDKNVLFSTHNEVVHEGDELYAVEQSEI